MDNKSVNPVEVFNNQSIWSFGNVVKWGALLLALFSAKSFMFGYSNDYIEVDILKTVITIAIVLLIFNFVISTITTSADIGNSAVTKYFEKKMAETAEYGKGYIAFSVALMTMTACSGITTYYGIANFLVQGNGGLLLSFIIPVILAFSSALITYAFWSRILFFVSNDDMSKFQKIRALTIYSFIGGLIIFCISTTTSVLGLGGKQAIKQHYLVSISEYKDSLSDVSQYRKLEARATSLLSLYTEKYKQLNEEEVLGNGITGTKGEGAVSKFLKTSSIEFEQALKILKDSQDYLDKTHSTLNQQLNLISDDLMKDDRQVSEIEKYTEQNLEQIKQSLVALKNDNQVLILKSLISYLTYNKQDLEVLSNNSDIASKQKSALVYYSNLIGSTSVQLQNTIDNLNKRTEPAIPKFNRINARDAIFTYWKDIFSIWIFCIVIDFWIIVWLLMFFDFGRKYIMFDNNEQYEASKK